MWSQKITKRTCFVPKIRQRLGRLLCFLSFELFLVFALSSKSSFVDTSTFFLTNLRPHFQNSFPFFFVLVILTLQCLKTCVTGVTKCVTAKLYPPEVKFSKLFFSKYIYEQFKPLFPKCGTI